MGDVWMEAQDLLWQRVQLKDTEKSCSSPESFLTQVVQFSDDLVTIWSLRPQKFYLLREKNATHFKKPL